MVLKKNTSHPALTTRLGKAVYLLIACAIFTFCLYLTSYHSKSTKSSCQNLTALLSSAASSNLTTTDVSRSLIYQDFDRNPNRKNATVLILTPLKDASPVLPIYFENVKKLSYPEELLSFGFLVSDSDDDTFEDLVTYTNAMVGKYRRISILQKNFGFVLSHGDRHALSSQAPRRAIMAQSRNYLLFGALNDEDWVLWLDADLKEFPDTLIEDLIGFDTDVVTPNVFAREKHNGVDYVYDRNNFIETRESKKVLKGLDPDDVLVEGYPDLPTYRRYLGDLRNTNKDIVAVDGVGGACLMVKANVHREGALFPTFPIDHELETEGFAKMAKRMGKQVCDLTTTSRVNAGEENSYTTKSWRIIKDSTNSRYFEKNLKPDSQELFKELSTAVDITRFRELWEADIDKLSQDKVKALWDIRAAVSHRMLPAEYQDDESSADEWESLFGVQVDTPAQLQHTNSQQQKLPDELATVQEEDNKVEKDELSPLQILGSVSPKMKYLLDVVQERRTEIDLGNDELKDLLFELRAVGSKWANNERMGQAELYEAMDAVLTALRNYPEHSTPFLTKVSKREAPDYAKVIEKPMDLSLIGKKMKNHMYNSKREFADDLYLIYSNCLKYNTNPNNPYREHANAMKAKTDILLRSVPDIVIRDRSEAETQAARHAEEIKNNGTERSADENSINNQTTATTDYMVPGKSVHLFARNDTLIEEDDEDEVQTLEITEQDAEGTTDDELEYDDYEEEELIKQFKLQKMPDIWDPVRDKETRARMFNDNYDASNNQPTLDAYPSAQIPSRGTAALINRNINLLKKNRAVHAKLGIIKQSQPGLVNQFGTMLNQIDPASPAEPPEQIPGSSSSTVNEEDLPPLVMTKELGHESMTRVVTKLLQHAGFEAAQSSALQVLTDVAEDYFLNLGKSIRTYLDDYTRSMTPEEIIQHSLFENGVPGVNILESYVKDEVERYGSKLADIHRRLETTYQESLMKSIFDDEEAFITGDFGGELMDELDIFGFKEMGLGNMKIPTHLLRPKNKNDLLKPGLGGKEASAYPTPPPWKPITDANTLIGLLRPFFAKKLEDSGGNLIEDELLPPKQRVFRPKVPITGIIPKQPKNKKPIKQPSQQELALKEEKKRKRELEAAQQQQEREERKRAKQEDRQKKAREREIQKKQKAAEKAAEKAAKKAAQDKKLKQKKAAAQASPSTPTTKVPEVVIVPREEGAEQDTETIPLVRRLKNKKRVRTDELGEGSSSKKKDVFLSLKMQRYQIALTD
ncbi:11589_t:CDS:10 [Ambispora leptoticha]|uniref:11589_t:CDS:1 n=1 Tax=Ambispora leptoticha TaxID=144679 RepID=A0A9N9C0C1_9GLOM|nr:11589_t:CDS:10 [Ambispora leptoticha]